MPPEVTKEFALECRKRGIRYFTMYGQAEATARMSYLPHEQSVERAGSIGRAIPGAAFWLEDDDGHKLEDSQASGELVFQGENVCMGYAESYRELALADELGGILRTGDLARRDSDGYYYITGRRKRFLKMFGHRINLQDVEDLLLSAGHGAACAGRDDLLEVFLTNKDPNAGLKVKQKLVAELKLAPGSVRVLCVSDFPRNEAGKIQYAHLGSLSAETLA